MEFDEIQKLMTGFEKSSSRELKIDDKDFHLYLSKNKQNAVATAPTKSSSAPAPADNQSAPAEQKPNLAIKAPLVGTVYLQPKPHQPAYVKVGDHVTKGQVVCVIEAMKMLTEVKSDRDGVIKSVKVENGDLVEYDQPLFTIEEG